MRPPRAAAVVVLTAAGTRAAWVRAVEPVRVGTVATDTGERASAQPSTMAPDSSSVGRATALAQQFATALADGDWDWARRLSPTLEGTEADLRATYEAVARHIVTPVAASVDGDVVTLELALVAHLVGGPSGERLTIIQCQTWGVDVKAATVRRQEAEHGRDSDGTGAAERRSYVGWRGPAVVGAEARAACS